MLQYPVQRVRAAPPLHQQKGARPAGHQRLPDDHLSCFCRQLPVNRAHRVSRAVGPQLMLLGIRAHPGLHRSAGYGPRQRRLRRKGNGPRPHGDNDRARPAHRQAEQAQIIIYPRTPHAAPQCRAVRSVQLPFRRSLPAQVKPPRTVLARMRPVLHRNTYFHTRGRHPSQHIYL